MDNEPCSPMRAALSWSLDYFCLAAVENIAASKTNGNEIESLKKAIFFLQGRLNLLELKKQTEEDDSLPLLSWDEIEEL